MQLAPLHVCMWVEFSLNSHCLECWIMYFGTEQTDLHTRPILTRCTRYGVLHSGFGCQFVDVLSCKGDIAPSLWVSPGPLVLIRKSDVGRISLKVTRYEGPQIYICSFNITINTTTDLINFNTLALRKLWVGPQSGIMP